MNIEFTIRIVLSILMGIVSGIAYAYILKRILN